MVSRTGSAQQQDLWAAVADRKDVEEMQQPYFTVIVALYNCEHYITECLDSLQSQTFSDFEAIVVDDCSTDNGLALAKRTVQEDTRFRFLDMPVNSGQGAARNRALDAARGSIVILLDADDLLAPQALERIAERFERQQLDDLYFNAESFYEDAEAYSRVVEDFSRRDDFDGVAAGTELFTFFENRGQFFPHGALRAVSRELIEADPHIRFPEGIIHEDLLFTFQTLVRSQRSSFLNEPLYRRRIRAGSTMGSEHRTMRNIEGHLVSIHWMEGWMRDNAASLDLPFIEAMSIRLNDYLDLCARDYLYEVDEDDKRAYLDSLAPEQAVSFEIKVAQRSEMIRRFYDSTTWKLGAAIVGVPQAARDKFHRLFRKRG